MIEIAWSSAPGDRKVKVPLYARADISEFWLVDIPGQFLEVYREPSPASYRRFERLDRSETVTPIAFPDVEISVGDIVHPIPGP